MANTGSRDRAIKLLIFGCDHKLQFEKADGFFLHKSSLDQHREQQKHFLQTIRDLITSKQITFIAEEFDHAQISVIHTLAEELGCQYRNVDMPEDERVKIGCHGNYVNLIKFRATTFHDISEAEADELISKCHQMREEYIAKRVFELTKDGESVLLVCGSFHADRLVKLCEPNFANVNVIRVSDYGWFNPTLYE